MNNKEKWKYSRKSVINRQKASNASALWDKKDFWNSQAFQNMQKQFKMIHRNKEHLLISFLKEEVTVLKAKKSG